MYTCELVTTLTDEKLGLTCYKKLLSQTNKQYDKKAI